MKLIIEQKGQYYCFKNDKLNDWTYRCSPKGGNNWFGVKSAYSPDCATIFDKFDKVICEITFQINIFKPNVLKIDIVENEKTVSINAVFRKNQLTIFPFSFQIDNDKYIMKSFLGHYRGLYQNDVQAASFDKRKFKMGERDNFITYCEDNMNIPLLFALTIFDDIWSQKDQTTFTIDLGNISGDKVPDNKEWGPKT